MAERALPIDIPAQAIADFCRRNHIRTLSLFGSVLRDDFRPDSDVDVLVEFEPGHTPGLAFFTMARELAAILGREVDFLTEGFFEDDLRELVKSTAYPLYDAA